jgi:hypothetical protein
MTIHSPTCTIVVDQEGRRCGKRSVTGLVSRAGALLGEYAEHVLPSRAKSSGK